MPKQPSYEPLMKTDGLVEAARTVEQDAVIAMNVEILVRSGLTERTALETLAAIGIYLSQGKSWAEILDSEMVKA